MEEAEEHLRAADWDISFDASRDRNFKPHKNTRKLEVNMLILAF